MKKFLILILAFQSVISKAQSHKVSLSENMGFAGLALERRSDYYFLRNAATANKWSMIPLKIGN